MIINNNEWKYTYCFYPNCSFFLITFFFLLSNGFFFCSIICTLDYGDALNRVYGFGGFYFILWRSYYYAVQVRRCRPSSSSREMTSDPKKVRPKSREEAMVIIYTTDERHHRGERKTKYYRNSTVTDKTGEPNCELPLGCRKPSYDAQYLYTIYILYKH